jgi:hypothetical protein
MATGRKPTLPRSAAIRSGTGLYRQPAAVSSAGTDDQKVPRYSTTLDSGEDAVVYGVRAGYRVLDTQIRRGAEYARKIRKSYERQGGSVDRATESTLDLMEQWNRLGGEVGETLLNAPKLLRWARDRWSRDGGVSSPDGHRDGGASPATQGAMLEALVQGLGLTVNSERPSADGAGSRSRTTIDVRVKTANGKTTTARAYLFAAVEDAAKLTVDAAAVWKRSGGPTAPKIEIALVTSSAVVATVTVDAQVCDIGEYLTYVLEAGRPAGAVEVKVE